MVKVDVLEIDAKTGKSKIVERDIELPKPTPIPKGLDLDDVKKLLKYAKSKGWI